ncbi:MAG: ATP-binding protein [Bacteroidetes bacterium]|nr:ATP-binding protein [Bacteroidota bacterium]
MKNDLSKIGEVIRNFESFGDEKDIPLPVIHKICIVLDELLNNIISYAYQDKKEHTVDINIKLIGERLEIKITDDGFPFNPLAMLPPDTKLGLEERELGGLGIHLVKNIMDEYLYKRSKGENIIVLVKSKTSTYIKDVLKTKSKN